MSNPGSTIGWKRRLALLLCGLFFAAVAMEIGLHVVNSIAARKQREEEKAAANPAEQYWAIADPDLGYRMNPRYADLNPDGLRDHPIGPKQGRFRLLMLGDSIGFYGDTVDDTFVGHMRETIHADPPYASVDVVNACIKGYTDYQEVGYLKKFGVKFEPDLVGIEFCLNDIPKFLMAFRFDDQGKVIPGSYNVSEDAKLKARSWPRRLMSQSALLVWLKEHLQLVRNLASWQVNRGFSFDYRTDINTAWQDAGWKDIGLQLGEAADLGRQRGFKLFLVVFPVATQYQPDYLARNRNHVLKPQAKLKEICERLNIAYYDLYPDFKPEWIGIDAIHLTPEGRRHAGRLIAQFVIRERLIPAGEKSQGQPTH